MIPLLVEPRPARRRSKRLTKDSPVDTETDLAWQAEREQEHERMKQKPVLCQFVWKPHGLELSIEPSIQQLMKYPDLHEMLIRSVESQRHREEVSNSVRAMTRPVDSDTFSGMPFGISSPEPTTSSYRSEPAAPSRKSAFKPHTEFQDTDPARPKAFKSRPAAAIRISATKARQQAVSAAQERLIFDPALLSWSPGVVVALPAEKDSKDVPIINLLNSQK